MKTIEKYCSEILKKERFNPADAENDIKIRRLEYLVFYLARKLDEEGQKEAGI